MKTLVPTFAIVALSINAVAEGLESGLQVGEKAGFFLVKDSTGPNAGNSLCYR